MRSIRRVVATLLVACVAATGCTPQPVPPTSRCRVDGLLLVCPYNTTSLRIGAETRNVLWQVPRGTPPFGGWPVVVMFQGTGATAALTWAATPAEPFGAYHQTRVVQRLLDRGFAVLTPETHLGGFTFWDTNNPLFGDYYASPDHALMLRLFDELDAGRFGPANLGRMFATGISSGGYMTSRMALSYPGRFRALAIQSGSWATCAGPLCIVGPIPADHPPTLFLHGALDPVVPLVTMDFYNNALGDAGVPSRRVVEPLALHRWIDAAPDEIAAWFQRYDPGP